MIYFLNGINLAPKMYICIIALQVRLKASWMQCPLHNQKVNKPGVSMVPHANWHHLTYEHTKYITYL